MGPPHQIQISFNAEQDRLLLRLNTAGRTKAEFRFWLTRRYVRVLWKALLNMLQQHQPKEVKESQSPIAKPMAIAQEHKEVVSQADFQTQYQESHVFPLGEEPILVSKVQLKQDEKGNQILGISPQEGEGVQFGLNNQLMHSICKLIVDATNRAEWDLNLDFGEAEELIKTKGLN